MAFILVLVISISTLVSVEAGATQSVLSRLRAEQNALLGVFIAVGELQKSAGADQRITASAEILEGTPDTLSVEGVANPYWLGVFNAVQSGSETQTREDLRAWSTDYTADQRVAWLVSARTDLSANGVDPIATDAITLNGGDPENVVTVARYENNVGAQIDVSAGKLDIVGEDTGLAGRYAWWVADENAKFRINATKEETVLDGQLFQPRWSLMAPHQSNPAIIPELASFDVSDSDQSLKVERIASRSSFSLIDPAWVAWADENGDDFTLASQSIPVDVTQGRLKEDLTVYLETENSGFLDTDFAVRGSSNDPGYLGQLNNPIFQLNHNALKLPQFGLIKSWYSRGMQLSRLDQGILQAPRPQTTNQSGLHPVILRAAVYFGVSYNILPDGNLLPIYLVYPKFVLWNPHNVPIAPAKYIVQVRAFTTLNTQINADLTNDGVSNPRNYAAINITPGRDPFGYQGNLPPQPALNTFAHLNLANNPASVALERDPDDDYPYFTFVIDEQDFAPGETLYFTGADKHPNADYVDEPVDQITGDFSDYNLLVNEDEGPLGFFYLPAGAPIVPLPNNSGDPVPTTGSNDVLQTTIYFRDTLTNAPEGIKEPSLSSKLYVFADGEARLLQKLDFKGADLAATIIDWEHIDTEGNSGNSWSPFNTPVSYRSLDYYKNINTFDAVAHRGHGYFIHTMAAAKAGNKSRMLARHNFAVSEISLDDPLVAINSTGRVYADSIPTANWFSGPPFSSEIPEDIAYQGIAANGYDRLGGYGLYENSSNFTQGTVYPFYDSVRSETGMLSIGFLKNVNFSQFYWQPSFPFGNSEAHTHVHRNNIKASQGGTTYTDLSYLLNESFFDRFYLSTIPQTGAFTPAQGYTLPNTRHRILPNADGNYPSASELRNGPAAYSQSAANIGVEGGFNVNSTSVNAWRMLLASYLGERVSTAVNSDSNSLLNSPLTARTFPLLAEGASVDPGAPTTWSALRSLTPSEIDALAIAIVEEVKRRGPFLSLSDFINRRLVGDGSDRETDFLGLKGTLQAAIDKVSTAGQSLLNAPFYQGSLAGLPVAYPDGVPINSRYPEHETGMPAGEAGSRMFGVPGFVTQGDLLAGLAPLLTVRGDTFTIRSYGESTGRTTGKKESTVWCEALVQRVADPVESGDSIVQPQGNFGRAFKVISVRWFNEGDMI